MRKAIVLLPALLAGCVLSVEPDPSLNPVDGSGRLSSFEEQTFQVTAGGNVAASTIATDCGGYVSEAPTLSVQYGTFLGLATLDINVSSRADTTLLVHTPRGDWMCDDDGGGGFNPALPVWGAAGGQYDIWVGTKAPGRTASATVHLF